MARIGAKGDAKNLRDLMKPLAKRVAQQQGSSLKRWTVETHVRSDNDAVHIDLHDLDVALVDEVVEIVLGQAGELFTDKVRFITGVGESTLDGTPISAHLLGVLKRWVMRDGRDWRVSNREGRPYVDVRKQKNETPAPAPPGRPSLSRRKSLRNSITGETFVGPVAEDGRDTFANVFGFSLAIMLSVPMLTAYYVLLNTAMNTFGRRSGGIAAIGLLALFGLMQFAILWLVQQLVRPSRINPCKKCGTVNRILPIIRRAPLQCGHCEAPLYGAWPIYDSQRMRCTSCQTRNNVHGDQLIDGIPQCSKCQTPLAANAQLRRGG